MKKFSFIFIVFVFAAFFFSSCRKNYQKLSTEYIRNLPDSCELLAQVENEVDHLVYFKGKDNNIFYCYNFETEVCDIIKVPKIDSFQGKPIGLEAGTDNVLVIYSDAENPDEPTAYDNTIINKYNLITRSFKELLRSNGCVIDKGKKQLTSYVFDTNRYGEGTRTDEIYDFDGKMLSQKEVEVIEFREVPDGTLAAQEQARIAQEQQANRLSLWECSLCKMRIPSKGKPEPGLCTGIFPHQWRRISYLE